MPTSTKKKFLKYIIHFFLFIEIQGSSPSNTTLYCHTKICSMYQCI